MLVTNYSFHVGWNLKFIENQNFVGHISYVIL